MVMQLPENVVKEIDNLIYGVVAVILVITMGFIDSTTAKTMAPAILGAILVKIKAN
jgi:hypothetical protein